MSDMDDLWDKSAMAASRLQYLADQMAERAMKRSVYGVGNDEIDRQIAAAHYDALVRVLELGEQLEQAAIDAGILPDPARNA